MNEHDIEKIFGADLSEENIFEDGETTADVPETQEDEEFRKLFAEEEPATAQKEKPVRRIHPLVWVGAALVVILAAAALWVNANFVIAGGFHNRDAQTLDLREKRISLKNYEKLTQELPGCDIHWSVPVGGDRFDCCSESIELKALKAEEMALFSHFTQLKRVDATAVELSVEEYRSLAAALPECYIRWSIPIGGSRYDSAAAEIAVADFTTGDVELFALFDGLKTVDANSCRDYDAILALQAKLPETKVLWTVELNGEQLNQDTAALTVDGAVMDYAALDEYLRRLPALEQVTVDNCALTFEEQVALLKAYPGIAFSWPVELLGKTYDSSVTELNFANAGLSNADLQAIADVLPGFYALELLDLSGCGFTAEQILPLYEIKPELVIYWEFELYGKTFSTTAKEMELSNIPIDDLAPLEDAIARMPHLEKVIMCDCGLSNEVMDGLNKKYEDIRFVWMLNFKGFHVRTDTLGFIANGNEFAGSVTQQDVDEYLIYCEDMVALDLGHKGITDLSFVQYMPHLKYLLLGATQVTDLSPLTQLKKLVFLELQLTYGLSEIAPLAECTSLRDLNIGYIANGHGQEYYDTFKQMTFLERLWYNDHMLPDDLDYQLEEDLPDCKLVRSPDPDLVCSFGWRRHPRYYEMRDLMQIYYMNEWGEQTPWKWADGPEGEVQLIRDLIPSQEASRAAALAEIEADRAAEKAARAAAE